MKYQDANPIQRFLRWSAATAPVSWLYLRLLHHIDRLTYRLTRGRHTISGWFTGLPVIILTTTGAKTGQQRTSPVVGVPGGDNLVVVASNWGQRHALGWYYNLRAYPTATVTMGGVSRRVRAREAIGDERDRLWQRDLEFYPRRAAYERRAANRRIPVVMLTPVSGQDHLTGEIVDAVVAAAHGVRWRMEDQSMDSPATNRANVAPASADLIGQLRMLPGSVYHRARRRPGCGGSG